MGNSPSMMQAVAKPAQYVTNVPRQGISDLCPPPKDSYTHDELTEVFPKGVSSDSLFPDPDTGRISSAQLQAHVSNLEGSGVLAPRPKVRVGTSTTEETDTPALVAQDTQLFQRLQAEYCHYEQRYRYALKIFLTKATSRNQSDNQDAQDMLAVTKTLNMRTNCVLEVMNFLAQSRVEVVNENKTAINNLNMNINKKLDVLKENYNMLNSQSAVVTTQKEMVRYTEEKNAYTTNQISAWAALNVLAIGTIFYVYRN